MRPLSSRPLLACLPLAVAVVLLGCQGSDSGSESSTPSGPNLLTYSRVDEAWDVSRGKGTVVAILDWQFDLSGAEAEKYVDPVSMVPGEEIGQLKPWHGEWMAEIVHRVAPEARILPIKARKLGSDEYQDYLVAGIRHAADQGACVVCSSMGPAWRSEELTRAIDYAEERGTLFVNVHPEVLPGEDGRGRFCEAGDCDARILRTGVVAVPDHPATPHPGRNLYTWPYDLEAHWEDGWGYSNAPPTVAGTVALMKSACSALTPADIRWLLVETAEMRDGFAVLDAAAAVRAAAARGDAARTGGQGTR
jgi:hypothetical protein